MLIVNCSIIKPTCFRVNVKAESWVTFKSTDVTMATAQLHIVGALHFRKTQDLTYQWVFFFLFPFRMCRAASLCGGDGADGTIRGCVRPTETLTSTEHQKQLWLLKVFFFLFLSFPADWDRFVCKGSAWIPSQTSVQQSLLFHGHVQASLRSAGGRNIPQFSSRCWILLSDLHFLCIYKAAKAGIGVLN